MSDVVVVSGLPRSGTSLMMQMLAAGGMPVLADAIRAPDESNPRGYWEYAAVKRTRADHGWVRHAPGKAVKVVHALLSCLPAKYHYRIVLMRRNIEEVIASQAAMLRRLGRPAGALTPQRLGQLLEAQLTEVEHWAAQREHVELLSVDFNRLMADPKPSVQAVNRFFGGSLNTALMCDTIDTSLYRNRC